MRNKKVSGVVTVILTVGSCAGFVATTVMVARASPKVEKIIHDKEKEKGRSLTVKETVEVAAPLYLPAVGVGAATLACIIGTGILGKKEQASLSSSIALVNNTFNKYKNKLIELYGPEADQRIQEELNTVEPTNSEIYYQTYFDMCTQNIDKDGEKLTFYDQYSDLYFEKSFSDVVLAEYHLNRNFILRGDATLNEWYELLGLPEVDGGDDLVWAPIDIGMEWIDFNHVKRITPSGKEYYAIEMMFEPMKEPFEY